MVQRLGISCRTLSMYSGVPAEKIDAFLSDPGGIPERDKYKLCAILAELEDIFGQ